MRPSLFRRLAAPLTVAGLALLGRPLGAQAVTELYVTPDTLRLDAGTRQAVTAQAFDDAGNAILAIRYRMTDTLIATVASNGTVTALARGKTQLTVTAGRKVRTILVVVPNGPPPAVVTSTSAATTPAPAPAPAPPVAAITQLIPEAPSLVLLPTEPARIPVRALRADGTMTGPLALTWKSLRPEVAMIADSSGTIVGLASGQGGVQAIAPNGVSVTVPVTVSLAEVAVEPASFILSPDDVDSLRVSVPAQGRRGLLGTSLQWSVSDPSVVAVTPEGIVRALGPGQAEVIARGFLQERRIAVRVHRRVAHFVVAPRLTEPVRLPANTTREFTLLPQTDDSIPIEGVPITWAVGDTTIASWDVAQHRLTARKAGTTTLSFAARGFAPRAWTIEVLPGRVGLDVARLSLRQGERTTLAAHFVDEAGRPAGEATGLQWSSSNAAIVRVSPDGAMEALGPGRTTVTVRSMGGPATELPVLVTAEVLVGSSRSGRFGLYALSSADPSGFWPVLTDSVANYLDAAYSPDRSRLAFVSDKFGNYDIFVADADGQNAVRVTADPAVDFQPVWSPDGKFLVFTSARGGTRQLHVVAADGAGSRQLTSFPGGAEEPAISPDGATVVFTGYPDGRDAKGDIFAIPFAGGAVRPVSASRDRHESQPGYLPTGELTWLQRRSNRDDPDQVLKQPAAGGLPVPLLSSPLPIAEYAISRDGTRLAWVTSGRPPEITFQWRTLGPGAEVRVRLAPGERITSPAF